MVQPTVFDDENGVAAAARERFRRAFRDSVSERGHFIVALAGGSSPLALYRLIGADQDLPWHCARVFFSDERFVPLDDPRSNFGNARAALLDHVPAHVFPIPVDADTVEEAALFYERQVIEVLGESPRFDWILLGMGSDGHTASLFPHRDAVHSDRWVVHSAPGILPPDVDRVTFTFRCINNAREVVVLATGAAKQVPLDQWLRGGESIDDLPLAALSLSCGELHLLADQAATGGT